MILLIDNYDSFVHNLARYVGELGRERRVVRNDAITIDEISAAQPQAIIISPGPCTPNEAGISIDVVRQLGARTPILGVCLGHQCVGQVYGGEVKRAQRPVHGSTSLIHHNGESLFEGLPNPLQAARYHSLIVELPDDSELDVTATSENGEIMAVAHRRHPVFGLQFHPESVLTEHGHAQLANFFRFTDHWHWSRSDG
ncbi:MAG: aminodeoxychorismate/anthranilate synthase component II [Alphaproteobacteria bacterium]|nr:aminodeoxychorismate/anthranilate synthase component II [Alphaproteobacteria bacterium]